MSGRTDTSRRDAAAESEAREEALRDADSFTEWLSMECARQPVSKWQPVLKDRDATDFAGWATADLMALALDYPQPSATRCAALDAIANRYCATPAIKTFIAERAGFMAVQMEEDARCAA